MRAAPSALRLRGSRAETRDSGTSGGISLAFVEPPDLAGTGLALVGFPTLFTRLLSLGSARDGARSSLEALAGAGVAFVALPDLASRLLSLGSARDGARSSLEDLAGMASRNNDVRVFSFQASSPPDMSGLLDFARRPRGKSADQHNCARRPRGNRPRATIHCLSATPKKQNPHTMKV